MATFSSITFLDQGIYTFNIVVESGDGGFSLHLGEADDRDSPTELLYTGLSFSGDSGFLFDQDQLFFGGYSKNAEINLKIYKKDNFTFSYFLNDVLIANNKTFSHIELDTLKLEKTGEVSVNIDILYDEDPYSGDFNGFLYDVNGIYLESQDNILLISNN